MAYKDLEKRRATDRARYAAHLEKNRASDSVYRDANRDKLNAAGRAYYAANPEKCRARARAWQLANPEKRRATRRSHRAANQEKLRADRRARYAANPEYERSVARAWLLAHPEKHRAASRTRRARKANAPINDFTAAQWKDMQVAYDHRCGYCGKRAKGHLTQDHILALSQGGSHTLHNIVPACRDCNFKKHTGPPLVPVQPMLLSIVPTQKKQA